MYKTFVRPILFLFGPEKVHAMVFAILRALFFVPGIRKLVKVFSVAQSPQSAVNVLGLDFPNRVGLAAGFDKDARHVDQLEALGFGFIEIGTLTPMPQPGNPQPRLFRLPKDKALINRMGFNNRGAKEAAERLKKRRPGVIIGGNIGRNKTTENKDASGDYLKCLDILYPVVDYFVVNISSPNTPGLRELQEKAPLKDLLSKLKDDISTREHKKPLLLKIAPDLENTQLDDIIEIVKEVNISGVIATNTTISREQLITGQNALEKIGPGGLSGRPLSSRSTEVIRYLSKGLGPSFTIIGAGGIFSAEDALEKLRAGASLVQLYTGFIYEGPGLIKKINKAIIKKF